MICTVALLIATNKDLLQHTSNSYFMHSRIRQWRMINNEMNDVYEGDKPYAFISYSHRDDPAMKKVKMALHSNQIKYWYDNGLHSGDDWNLVIASHLQNATVCLLLLSRNSASSEYVKNELNFAMNHRVPIHTILLEDFVLPPDVEMMTGRRQMINLSYGFEEKLVRSLPIELLSNDIFEQKSDIPEHPLFSIDELLFDRQGTKTYIGHHKKLGYKCIIQQDDVSPVDKENISECVTNAVAISHPVFPRIFDVMTENNHIWTFQEDRNEQFLDFFLQNNKLSQSTILDWLYSIVDSMECLFDMNCTLRDFSRGSVTVLSDNRIGIFRLQNIYYGVYKINQETKGYYFDVILQEISILLAQLCLRESPVIPIRIIETPEYERSFLSRVNLIIQKCTRIDGKTAYSNFPQIKNDIRKEKLSRSDKALIRERAKRLSAYEKEREKRRLAFSSNEDIAKVAYSNLEEQFGYEGTTILSSENEIDGEKKIRIRVMSTGQVFESSKERIIVGKDKSYCDFLWTQPYISRHNCDISRLSASEYLVVDTYATNHVFIKKPGEKMRMLEPGEECKVPVNTMIRLSSSASEMQLL